MTRLGMVVGSIILLCFACGGDSTGPEAPGGTYVLVEENGQMLPSDPSAPYGCCLTLSGSISLTSGTYDLRTSYRNKNNGIVFDNSEQGSYTQQGSTLLFVRTGGGGEGFPYLLAPGTLSPDNTTVTLLYGDEGPGSNQIRGTFRR